jgi:hypothetical protein
MRPRGTFGEPILKQRPLFFADHEVMRHQGAGQTTSGLLPVAGSTGNLLRVLSVQGIQVERFLFKADKIFGSPSTVVFN